MTSDEAIQTDETVKAEVSFAAVATEGRDASMRKEREATAHLSDSDDSDNRDDVSTSEELSDVDGEQNAAPHQPTISSMMAFGPDSSSDASAF